MKVPIEIFWIGRTEVNRAEVKRWLDFLGVSENVIETMTGDETISNPALLIALAAKRCYKSFEPGLNPNVTKVRQEWGAYLDNVLASGHGSVLEHSVYNVAIENVSRVFTAEMNRHRAGWAISEGSLRYIRFGDGIPYWEPDSIRGPDVMSRSDLAEFLHDGPRGLELADPLTLEEKKHLTRAIMEEGYEEVRQRYNFLQKVWEAELSPDSKFSGKKQITSMMRRIIPLGVATGGTWSGNVRALRHVLTMRAAPEAEEEMIHVFSRVAVGIREREPLLFGDFYQDDQGFWRPKYKKV